MLLLLLSCCLLFCITQTRRRGLDAYGRFGYTLHTGNTPDPMVKILREISDAEQSEIQQGRIIPGNMVGKVRTHQVAP